MRIAVMDIGSNAIRAAIYDSNELGAAEIFNEKFKSDILSLLDMDSLDIRHGTYNIFGYFVKIFNQLNVAQISCVATEVLRNHKRAEEFLEVIHKRYNIKIKILSGDEEARITSEGLISSIPDAEGVAADLGGGSLELAEVYDKKVHNVKSLSIGTKVLSKLQIENSKYITECLTKEFQTQNCKNLYLIGGALRLLGRCYMDYNHSVIKNLHNLIIDPAEFTKFLDELETLQKFQQFFKQYKINRHAITVMRGLIEYFNPYRLVISTFGLKEGVRFGALSKEEQKKDIALERCLDFAKHNITGLSLELYQEVFKTLNIEITKDINNLLIIGLILSQYPRHVDRSYRAEWMIGFILTTDIPFNQHQRASLIISLAQALSNKTNLVPKAIKKILSKEQNAYANIIGAFLKIAMILDGPVLSKPSFSFEHKNKFIEVVTHTIFPKAVFDRICEQLKMIAISKRSFQE